MTVAQPPSRPAPPRTRRSQPPELEGLWCNDGGCTHAAVVRCARCQYVFCAEHADDHINEGAGCGLDQFGEGD